MNAKMKKALGSKCHYGCGRPATTVDHIIPKSRGGLDRFFNYVASCEPCNQAKASKMPHCRCPKCKNAVKVWEDGAVRGLDHPGVVRCNRCGWEVQSPKYCFHCGY